MSTYQQIVITIDAETLVQVRARLDANVPKGKPGNNLSGTISDNLYHYYDILEAERFALRPMFSAAECAAILDLPRYTIPSLVWAAADNAQRAGELGALPEDGRELVAKLRSLTRSQACALVDAIERWHIQPGAEPGALLAEEVQP